MDAKLLKRDIKKLRHTQKMLSSEAKKAFNRKEWKKVYDYNELIEEIERIIKEAEADYD